MQIKFISPSSSQPRSLLGKALALVMMVVLAAVALMFSAVSLAVILILAVFGGAYLWWKTRELRKHFKLMQEQMQKMQQGAAQRSAPGDAFEGEIIEGEVVHADEPRSKIGR
jgi:threonine/homoserine/homoserine lactone efflux protein